jgi:type IV pilus assembly protein PilY1
MTTLSSLRNRLITRWFVWALAWAMLYVPVPAGAAGICGPEDLADVPLELTAGSGPPSLMMIAFDNGDSMDYEFLTDEPNRLFAVDGTQYVYLFSGSHSSPSPPRLEGVSPAKHAWKSRWYEHNKMYYNPHAGSRGEYTPWPTKPAADVNAPWWHPQTLGATTYDLTAAWGAYELGVLVEADEEEVLPDVPIVIVDDRDAGFSKTGSNWELSNTGYDGRMFWTKNARNQDHYATWTTQDLDPEVAYNIFVYCDAGNNNENQYPQFTIKDDNTTLAVVSNFHQVFNGWKRLAARVTFASGKAKVQLYIRPNDNRVKVGADAVMFVPTTSESGIVGTGEYRSISRRHFFIESLNGQRFLVDLAGADTANFYLLADGANPLLKTSAMAEEEGGLLIEMVYEDLPFDIQTAGGGPLPPPGAGAYQTHLENFANWFTYYRKRRYAAQNAVAVMVTEVTNMLVGMETNPPSSQTGKTGVRWINTHFDGQHYDQTAQFLAVLYNLPPPSSESPFPDTILSMGKYFDSIGGTIANASADFPILTDPLGDGSRSYATTSASGTYPFFTEDYGGHCQQSFCLVVTDGVAMGGGMIHNHDGDNDTRYDGGVFGDAFTKTIAAGAMQFYEKDMKTNLRNEVPSNYIDYANHQRMVTYAVSLGAEGALRRAYRHFDALCADINNNNACICAAGCPTWGDPNASTNPMDPIDDLWHATVNSRGIFLYADNPMELVQQLRLIKADIERRQGSAAAVTTNTVQRTVGAVIFQGLYHSLGWWGDLLARSVDVASGTVGTTLWSAQDRLEDTYWGDRNVFTSNGSAGIDFDASNAGTIGLTAAQIEYLLGDHSNEGPDGFRIRDYKLGDIIHSEPYYHEGVLYVGANDGMLHAFDAETGQELFAYVPSHVHGHLDQLTLQSYEHLYYVDATAHVASFTGTPTYLAGGLGKGGRGVYCLDVTNAKNGPTAANVFNWEFSAADDADMGYLYGNVYIANTHAGPAVIFGNGYASDAGKAVLYVLDAATGAQLAKFDTGNTGTDSCNGMSSPALIDYDFDGIVDYVYAGDLDGNLWKFDLTASDHNHWTIAYSGNPLFTARDPSGNVQAITSEPDVTSHCETWRKGFIVAFGTGRYLNADDLTSNPANQAIYGIYDWEQDWDASAQTPPAGPHLGALAGVSGGQGNLSVANFVTLVQQTKLADVVDGDDTYRVTSDNEVNWYDPYLAAGDANQGEHAGWYYLLPDSSERIVRRPMIRANVVIAVANTIESGACSGSAASYIYALDVCTGGRPKKPQFDVNGDTKFDASDTVTYGGEEVFPSGQRFETMLFDPIAMGGMMYVNDTFGNIVEQPIPPDPPNVMYWLLVD